MRTDIQALRGVAVLLVVLYHLKIGPWTSGFLGVDIFFVISGYLITGLIARAIDGGRFTLTDFYTRRARRLLPAAYATFAATAAVAPWLLNDEELRDLVWQMAGSLLFSANFVLWQQVDYFGTGGDFKPLLHVWSLSLEEQYYMVLPALLLWLPRHRWRAAILALLVASGTVCAIGMVVKPIATFYLLPTRAWELMIGSAAALAVDRGHAAGGAWRWSRRLWLPALVALLIVPMLPVGRHPGVGAWAVCLATAIVIVARHPGLKRLGPTRWLAWIGDRSYSLYLVHWPLIAFAHNAWSGTGEGLPLSMSVGLLGTSVAAAWALHRWVEDPVRHSSLRLSRPVVAGLTAGSVLLLAWPLTVLALGSLLSEINWAELRRVNVGMHNLCAQVGLPGFVSRPECKTSSVPSTLVWGDSYAMHMVPGLQVNAARLGGIEQATKSACAPFPGRSPWRSFNPPDTFAYDDTFATECLDFNRKVLAHLETHSELRLVLIASSIDGVLASTNRQEVVQDGEYLIRGQANPDHAVRSMLDAVARLRSLGKQVVFIAPPPTGNFNVGSCLERQYTGRITFGAPDSCQIDMAEYRRRRADVLALLERIESGGVPVIRFDSLLCDATVERCRTSLGGVPLYRDSGHLTYVGSERLAAESRLVDRIEQIKR